MRVTIAALTGIVVGGTAALYARRYAGAFLTWIFTADVRRTDPHLYGRRGARS